MILFVVTPPYRRHFPPRRQVDAMPVKPLVDVLLYWFCSTFGGLFGSVGVVALITSSLEGVHLQRSELIALGIMTALSPLLFFIAYRSWRKLNH